ncbi:MOSC domain-containing protein [Marinobacter sp. chi1]|uniref:MOSC domain-containing protein n=1 Tax=Marinobacter suaedae TaxID=3057675 RepID=A0ABT8W1C0_9GAMM|nr:MOSC N-terminal beta barrel domain-containing protein [Marinobacter sp. chi1]MDO3722020.1 MOSC domain-containing protein [Marinobacter sp. chi1]
MNVQFLWVYPVKSLAGIRVEALDLDDFGPAHDRRWMLVDDNGRFVTQRTHPELAKIKTSLAAGEVGVEIPGYGSFALEPTERRLEAKVWGDQVNTVLGAEEANAAVSAFCQRSLRFVFMPEDSFRQIDPDYVTSRRRVGFADGYPLLIANQASLEELNGRLRDPVEMRRFRPNVVVSGFTAWQEDHWRELSVGTVRLSLAKPCSRCVMTTVDPEVGVKDSDGQPLKTLSGYRRQKEGVIFGMNAIHQSRGCLSVGDPVSVIA